MTALTGSHLLDDICIVAVIMVRNLSLYPSYSVLIYSSLARYPEA